MLSSQWHKVLNDLWGNKTRTLLIVLSIAVGLFATGVIVITRTILSAEMEKGYAAITPSSGTLRIREPFDQEFVRSVRAMKDVQEADARRSFTLRVRDAAGKWRDIRLFAIADFDDMRVNKVAPQRGAWPPPEHDVLIERAALDLLGVQVGDAVLIELPDEKQREMRVAGLAHDLTLFPARFSNTPYGYIAFSTLEWLGEPYGFNELHITVAEHDKAFVQSVVKQVEDKAKRSGFTVLMTSVDKFPLEDMVQAVLVMLTILGLLSLGLSAFLIVNTISALLAQQVRQIGVMKAIGARTGQIMSMYLAMVVLYGLIALLIAMPLSVAGGYALCRLATGLLNFDLTNFYVPLETIALQAATGLIVPVLASLYPFLSGLRVTAAEAMSTFGTARRSFGTNWLDRLFSGANVWFARHFVMRSLLLSLRNTFRSKGRLTLTLITLTLAGAIFISVFSVRASLFRTIEDLTRWQLFDSTVTFTRPYRTDKIEQEALRVPGVAQTDVWINLPVQRVRDDKTESDTVFLYAPNSDSALVSPPVMLQGRWLTPGDEDGVVVNAFMLKKEPDIQMGDEIVLKINGQERPWRVIGVCLGGNPPVAYANYASVARLTGNVGRAATLLVASQRRDSTFAGQVAQALESHFKSIGVRTSTVETTAEERNHLEDSFGILIIGLLVMAVLFAVVGGLGLMGTMSINVLERTREIGVMRAIGASSASVAQVFVLESVAIGIMSWLLGCAAALPLGKLMSDALGVPLMGVPITFAFSAAGVWLWLIVVVMLSILASFIPARNASRLTVREVLAYE